MRGCDRTIVACRFGEETYFSKSCVEGTNDMHRFDIMTKDIIDGLTCTFLVCWHVSVNVDHRAFVFGAFMVRATDGIETRGMCMSDWRVHHLVFIDHWGEVKD